MNPRNFFAELKRRNVYKVAVAYAVIAWLLIQAGSILFPTFEAPGWLMKVFVSALGTGFPIALVIAWAFEMTPQGMKRTENVSPNEHIPQWSRRKFAALIVSLAIAAGGLLLFQFTRWNPAASTSARAEPTSKISPKSIAVLPFKNLSDDQQNAYFAAGIQDEILTALAKIGELKVIARTSTDKYQSQPSDLKTLAAQLDVATVLEGSVQKSGERAHVNVQLIDAQTNAHLWAESYDRELADIFAVEREIAERVAKSLSAKLRPAEAARLADLPTADPAAYDLYLKANYLVRQFMLKRTDITPALELYQKAIELDPSFALAYAQFSAAESRMYMLRMDFTPARLASAQRHAEKALALKPDLAEGHFARGLVYFVGPQAYDEALVEWQLAAQMQPNNADFLSWIAWGYAHKGEWEKVLATRIRNTELDPRSGEHFWSLASTFESQRRYAEAERAYAHSLALDPESDSARLGQISFFLITGKLQAARDALAEMRDPALAPPVRAGKYLRLGLLAELSRDFDAALTAYEQIESERLIAVRKLVRLAFVHLHKGNKPEAERKFQAAQAALARYAAPDVNDPDYFSLAAKIHAGLGEREQAVAAAERAVALMPISKSALDGTHILKELAETRAFLGEADAALPLIRQLLTMPGAGRELSPALLRLDPIWDPIRNDPRFQELSAEGTKP